MRCSLKIMRVNSGASLEVERMETGVICIEEAETGENGAVIRRLPTELYCCND